MASFLKRPRIGVDINSDIRIWKDGEIVVAEPFSGIWDKDGRKLLYWGTEAERLFRDFPHMFNYVRPDFADDLQREYFEQLLGKFISSATGKGFLKPQVLISFCGDMKNCGAHKLKASLLRAGAGTAEIMYAPLAAALGEDVGIPQCTCVVHIGRKVTDIAIMVLGQEILSRTLNIGGFSMDKSIVQYIKNTYNMHISRASAERIKLSLEKEDKSDFLLTGRDFSKGGLPGKISISREEAENAVKNPLKKIGYALREFITECPVDIAEEILKKGVILTGTGSLLPRGAEIIGKAAGIKCMRGKKPSESVIAGFGKYIEYCENAEENVS